MKSITLRDIPEDILDQAKALAVRDRRSLNQSLILLLEEGLKGSIARHLSQPEMLSRTTQLDLWSRIAGAWEDSRSTTQIVTDIYTHRTKGRSVKL